MNVGWLRRAAHRTRMDRVLGPLAASVQCARAVQPSHAFLSAEIRRRGQGTYAVRGTSARCVLEHGTTDVPTFDQAFVGRFFDPPPEIAERLSTASDDLVLLDLGANIGMWTVWAGDALRPRRTIAVEPIPRNCDLLNRNVDLNPLANGEVICAAAGTTEGTATFAATTFTTGSLVDGEDDPHAITVRVIDALDVMQSERISFLKMDIEGGEWPILSDPRFSASNVTIVFFEFHPAGCPSGDAKADALRLIREAGFRPVESHVYSEAGDGVVWAWR